MEILLDWESDEVIEKKMTHLNGHEVCHLH